MKLWSRHWTSSINRRKQRKYRANAPLHQKGKFLNAALSKELKKKIGRNTLTVIRGDTVQILRGEYAKITGEVEEVNRNLMKLFVRGASRKKVDGSETKVAIDPSNVRITQLKKGDKRRIKGIDLSEEVESTKEEKKVNVKGKKNKEEKVSKKEVREDA